jgi:predicted tellurium resistance membrane protein TerC
VFLFSLLLAYFLVPPERRGRVILIGIAGALLLRGVAIVGGVALIGSLEAIVYVFGVLLLYVAYRTFRGAPEQSDPSANPSFVLSVAPSRSRRTSAVAGSSFATEAVSTARRCCWWRLRSSLPTSPSPWTRSRRRSPSPATPS